MITQEQVDENRQKWLAVLRAPESSKAVGVLESRTYENSRCCLGHACHALGITRTVTTGPEYVRYDSESKWLPPAARRALRINANGNFKKTIEVDDKVLNSLAQVNDRTELSPAEIADVIEDQIENDNFFYP